MKTRFNAMLLLLTICTTSSFAQDTAKTDKKIREYVLSLANIAPLNASIKYKKQLKGKTFFKAELINLSAGSSEFFPELSTYNGNSSEFFSGGLQFGLEFRKNSSGDFSFFHGPSIGSTYSTTHARSYDPTVPVDETRSVYQNYNVGVSYSVGILFHLKGHFFMSAEINPGIHTTWERYKSLDPVSNNHRQSTSFGFGNTYGLLSLVYRR